MRASSATIPRAGRSERSRTGFPQGPAMDPDVDAAFIRGLTQARLSRRTFIEGAAGAGLAGLLAACGVAGTKGTGAGANVDWDSFWAKQKKQGTLDWANWPL